MNRDNNKNNNSGANFDDNYDYLDNLMNTFMEDEEEVVVDNNEEDLGVNDESANENQSTRTPVFEVIKQEISESEIDEGGLEVEESLKEKRAPLFARFFQDEYEDNNDDESNNSDEDKVIEESESASSPMQLVNELAEENLIIDERETTSKVIHSGIKSEWENSFLEEEEELVSEYDDEYGEDEEDSFDDMFADLLGEDTIEDDIVADIDSEANQESLDPEVITPIEKPGMDKVIVTPDGRSLAEMIPGIRGGARKSQEVLAEIKEQKRVVEVDDKKFSDNRYTKHIEIAEEKKAERDKRIELSRNFLQKHARFTEQEKIILTNLGLSSDEFRNIISSKELSIKDKEELIGLGRYGPEKHFKGKRYRTTVGDLAILEFLVKFKFANTRILRWLSNESQNTTFQKLRRLEHNGLIENKSIIGVPDLWGATLTGVGLAGYSLKPGLKPMPKMQTISSTMGVNYLAACLWFNSVNVLNLDDFPASNRLMGLENGEFKRVRGEDLVSELEIRSSLGKEINPYSSTVQNLEDERLYDVIAANVRTEFEKWENNGKQGMSPEVIPGNEYMWVLYPTSQLTLSYHVPDLVVRRERGPNGEPRSIAVELERHTKTNDRYDKIMLAYKLDEHLYEKVIWVTPNARSARALDRAAQEVGFTRYEIIPIITETGIYNKADIWLI